MFKEMRRSDKSLSADEMLEILQKAPYGVLSTADENGFPYGVPLNFVYKERNIYFHSALNGHKVDNMQSNNRACFTVVTDVEIIPDDFNTKFKSVICFGKIREISGEEKRQAYMLLLEKFSGDYIPAGIEYINKAGDKARVFSLEVEHMTAKGKK